MTASADNTMRALDMGGLLGGELEDSACVQGACALPIACFPFTLPCRPRPDFVIEVSPSPAPATARAAALATAAAAAAAAGGGGASLVSPRRVPLTESSLLALLREFVSIPSVSQDVRTRVRDSAS